MTATVYARYELIRLFRNTRFFIISLGFPVILFFLVAGPNRHSELGGIPFALYYMGGMAAWGTMASVIGAGARIAAERSINWNRTLRLTPLAPRAYLATKLVSGYALAVVSLVVLYAAGVTMGVRLSTSAWLHMTGLILVGLIPFAVLGVLLGHVLSVDGIGPAIGGVTSLFALLGGAYGPLASSGAVGKLIQLLPSYWLVQAGKVAAGETTWPLKAWLVVAVWTVVLARLAAIAWRRDTQRA
jgi:ABC-2 type transport system permease protein